jgi:hypothetical protein
MGADAIKQLARHIAEARGLADAIPEAGAWSLTRELKHSLRDAAALLEAEAAALGEPAPADTVGADL